MTRFVTFNDAISREILEAFMSVTTETIYTSSEIDEFTFNRLKEIAAGFKIELKRGEFSDVDFRESYKAKLPNDRLFTYKVIDELQTLKKAIDRLKDCCRTL